MAATSDFLLRIDSSRINQYGMVIASDNSGASYSNYPYGTAITKLAADGNTIIWQHSMDGNVIGVDASGSLYVSVYDATTSAPAYSVEKLNADGVTVAWKTQVAAGLGPDDRLYETVDQAGRVYIAYPRLLQTVVARLKADGNGTEYETTLPGSPWLLAADGTGSAILVLEVADGFVLTRLSSDGSSQVYSVPISLPEAIAADAGGDVAVLSANPDAARGGLFPVLRRFNPQGQQTLFQPLPGMESFFFVFTTIVAKPSLAMDEAGNTYVVGAFLAHAVRNSLASCDPPWSTTSLLVYGPDGSLLQGSYLPGANPPPYDTQARVVVGHGPVVYVTSGDWTLTRLAPHNTAQTVALACVVNAASYGTFAVAPGEIVALFGTGLGPQQGIQTTATLEKPFPTQVGDVQVTFDDMPAPLLWVQEAQVNAVAPWALRPGQDTKICVVKNGVKTNCLTETVMTAMAGVFTTDGYHAVAINEDGTINSAAHPAHLNSIITLYATGMGPISPAQADGSLVGLPLPVNVLETGFGFLGPTLADPGAALVVDYAGPAPYELAGVTQINARVQGKAKPIYPFFAEAGYNDGGESEAFTIYVTAD